MMEKLSLDKFEEAYERVQEVVLPPNLVQSDFFSQMTGNKVYFKKRKFIYFFKKLYIKSCYCNKRRGMCRERL